MGLPPEGPDALPDEPTSQPHHHQPPSQPPPPQHNNPSLNPTFVRNGENADYLHHVSKTLKTTFAQAGALHPSVEKALTAVGALPTRHHLIQFLHYIRPLTDTLSLPQYSAIAYSHHSKDKSPQLWSSQHLPRSARGHSYDWPVSNHSAANSFTDEYNAASLQSAPGLLDVHNVHHAKAPEPTARSIPSSGSLVRIMRSEERESWAYKRFLYLQQCPCKELAVNIIREIDPKKQQDFPYKRARSGGSTPRPPFWPDDPTIRNDQSPSHLKKDERIRLLVHFLFLPVNNYEYYQEWKTKTSHASWAAMLEYAVDCTTLRSDGPKRAKGGGNPDSGTNRKVDRAQILCEVSDDEKVKIKARRELLTHLCYVAREVEMGAGGGSGPDHLLRLPSFPDYYARKEEASESRRRKRKSPLTPANAMLATSKVESDSEIDEDDDEPFTERRPSRASSVTPADEDEVMIFTDDESSNATKASPPRLPAAQVPAVDKKRKLPGSPPPPPTRTPSTVHKRPSLTVAAHAHAQTPSRQQRKPASVTELNPGFAVLPGQGFVAPTQPEQTFATQQQQPQQRYPNFQQMNYSVPASSFGNEPNYMLTSPLTPESRRISLQSPMPLSSSSAFMTPQATWTHASADLHLQNSINIPQFCNETGYYPPDGVYDNRNMPYLAYDGINQHHC